MERKIRFLDGREELTLPVTPGSFEITDGINMETVNLTGVGDLVLPAGEFLRTITLSSFFPASPYPFSTQVAEPYSYAAWFSDRAARKRVLRFLVEGTGLSLEILVESIAYGEKDGTNDVYYTLTLQRYRRASGDGSGGRAPAVQEAVEYVVKWDDTLSIIAQEHYGDMWKYPEIMAYNGLTDTMIHPGDILLLPVLS